MKDWLAGFGFFEDAKKRRIGRQGGFHLSKHCRLKMRLDCLERRRYRITLPGTIGWGASLSNCMEKANIRV
jgi:hypothetical protein